jgi:hypothetical protein
MTGNDAEVFDADFDLIIEDGDFAIGEATLQHQNVLLLLQKGETKQYPTVGVAIRDYINEDTDADELRAVISQEFENDGMTIGTIILNSFEDIQIKASY